MVLASFPGVIWFFVVRRRMIRRISYVARALESVLRPRDLRYWYLGYLVGFRARYWVNRGPVVRVSALYTIPPLHVFFYLPVILLARRRERLELTVEVRRPAVGGEAHLVDEGRRLVRSAFLRDVGGERGLARFRRRRGPMGLSLYEAGDGRAAEIAVGLAESLAGYGRVNRVTVDGGRGVVHASLDLEPGARVEGVVEGVLGAAGRLAGRGEAPGREAGDGG